MKVRFLADYDLNAEIVDGLLRRESSIDIKTGFEAGLQAVSDPDVLAMATDEGRVLVTQDHRTMPRHFAEFISQRQSPGCLSSLNESRLQLPSMSCF
jgi:predicted nuclease of predicted toxin-antitoxin system